MSLFQRLRPAKPGAVADVSICIPAWMAESFIENTIRFAAGQTHRRIAILISVDKSTDATGALCRAHAAEDKRITVFEQHNQLGWAGNVNFLLDRVGTPYFFLYFHDDIIVPQYTEVLLRELEKRPDAISVHCDMGHFGGSEKVSIGRAYEGSATQRLMAFLLAPARGSPLRSLTRSCALDNLRVPDDAVNGMWANEPYLINLLASGPALHVAETMYLRWDQRKGGLTDEWKDVSPEVTLSGHKANIASAIATFDATAASPLEREVLIFSLYVHMVLRMRQFERRSGVVLFRDPAELHSRFSGIGPPQGLATFGAELAEWAMAKHRAILRFDDNRRAK